jgi:hypothetical protein
MSAIERISNMNKLRELVISMLDDDNGVSGQTFALLNELAEDHGIIDIIVRAEQYDNRFFLEEGDVEDLRKNK